MKLKSFITAIIFGQLFVTSISYSQFASAQAKVESVEEEIHKGPNNGRLLQDGDFTIELSIFENGVEPEFRVFATKGQKKLATKDVEVNVKLTRLDGVVDDIHSVSYTHLTLPTIYSV